MRDTPPELQALLNAYCEATEMTVTMSLMRAQMLTDIHSRGLTAEDITAVIIELKRRIKQDTRGFYTSNMLEFRNVMEPDKLEERAARLRQEQKRKVKVQDTPHQRGQFTVLDKPESPEPTMLDRSMIADSIRSIATNLERKQA